MSRKYYSVNSTSELCSEFTRFFISGLVNSIVTTIPISTPAITNKIKSILMKSRCDSCVIQYSRIQFRAANCSLLYCQH